MKRSFSEVHSDSDDDEQLVMSAEELAELRKDAEAYAGVRRNGGRSERLIQNNIVRLSFCHAAIDPKQPSSQPRADRKSHFVIRPILARFVGQARRDAASRQGRKTIGVGRNTDGNHRVITQSTGLGGRFSARNPHVRRIAILLPSHPLLSPNSYSNLYLP